MLSKYSQVTKILTDKNKKMALYAIFLASVSGLFDLLGVSSILPFLSALSNPEIIRYFFFSRNCFKSIIKIIFQLVHFVFIQKPFV